MEAKYIKDYHPNLLSWNELAYLINIRPLMTKERVKLLDPQKREFKWKCTGWHRNPDCYPPSLIRLLLDEMVMYFTDMSRATKNLNDFASKVEDEYQKQTDAHIYVCRNPELEHPFGAHYDDAYNILNIAVELGYFTGIGINQKGDVKSRFIHLDMMEASDQFGRPTIWSY